MSGGCPYGCCAHCAPDFADGALVCVAFLAGALWMLGWAPWRDE